MSEISEHKLAHLREQDTDCGLRSCIVCRTTFTGQRSKADPPEPWQVPLNHGLGREMTDGTGLHTGSRTGFRRARGRELGRGQRGLGTVARNGGLYV
jgi:hypothetical protein